MNKTNLVRSVAAGKMTVAIYDSRLSMGNAAAIDAAIKIREMLKEKDEVNILFACAVSQTEFFAALFAQPDIEWRRINGFVMDEYMGLDKSNPGLLANFANANIFSKKTFSTASC